MATPVIPSKASDSVEEDLRELVSIMPRAFRGLKRGGPVPEPFREEFEESSLGPRHLPALMTVTFEGPLSVSEIAERIGLSVATTSLMVGELDREGLVQRSEDEDDRRRTIVALRESYREVMDGWLMQRLEPLRRTLQNLDPEARAHFMQGWRILLEESERMESADCD
jgi:DNA-binding MarR family transcriptional regulator